MSTNDDKNDNKDDNKDGNNNNDNQNNNKDNDNDCDSKVNDKNDDNKNDLLLKLPKDLTPLLRQLHDAETREFPTEDIKWRLQKMELLTIIFSTCENLAVHIRISAKHFLLKEDGNVDVDVDAKDNNDIKRRFFIEDIKSSFDCVNCLIEPITSARLQFKEAIKINSVLPPPPQQDPWWVRMWAWTMEPIEIKQPDKRWMEHDSKMLTLMESIFNILITAKSNIDLLTNSVLLTPCKICQAWQEVEIIYRQRTDYHNQQYRNSMSKVDDALDKIANFCSKHGK